MNPDLDHIIWACADLDRASRRFESLTGVRPRYGGRHASGLTHNALVSLGERCYLEILAPAGPAGPDEDDWCRFARAAPEPRLFTYCMRSSWGLAELAPRAASLGCRNGVVAGNGRTTPDGVQLRWQWLGPTLEPFGRAFPFFIDWLDSPHPAESCAAAESTVADEPSAAPKPSPSAESSAAGEPYAAAEPSALRNSQPVIRLTRFAVGHPDAASLRQVLSQLTSPVETYVAPTLEFQVQLGTPLGRINL